MSIFLVAAGLSLMIFIHLRNPLKMNRKGKINQSIVYKRLENFSIFLWLAGIVWLFFDYPILIAVAIAVGSFVIRGITESFDGMGMKKKQTSEAKE